VMSYLLVYIKCWYSVLIYKIGTHCNILTEWLLTVCDLLSGAFHVGITYEHLYKEETTMDVGRFAVYAVCHPLSLLAPFSWYCMYNGVKSVYSPPSALLIRVSHIYCCVDFKYLYTSHHLIRNVWHLVALWMSVHFWRNNIFVIVSDRQHVC